MLTTRFKETKIQLNQNGSMLSSHSMPIIRAFIKIGKVFVKLLFPFAVLMIVFLVSSKQDNQLGLTVKVAHADTTPYVGFFSPPAAWTAAGNTNLALKMPDPRTNDLMIATIAVRPSSAGFSTPSGWTLQEDISGSDGNSEGSDLGTVRYLVFTKIADGTEGMSNQTFTKTGTPSVSYGYISQARSSTGTYDITAGGYSINGDATNWNGTLDNDIGLTAGDLVIIAGATNGDLSSHSAQGISATGVSSISTVYEQGEYPSTTGNDVEVALATGLVWAGTNTATPTITYTLSVASSGIVSALRVRAGSGSNRTDTWVRSVGAKAVGTSSVAVPYPEHNIGDRLILYVANRYDTATPTTPSGWTLISNNHTGGYGTNGADAGTARISQYYKDVTSNLTGTQSVTVTSGNTSIGQMVALHEDDVTSWVMDNDGGSDNSPGTGWSVAGSGMELSSVDGGYLVLVGSVMNTDAYTYTSHNLSASGITFGEITQATEYRSGTGNDVTFELTVGRVSAGSKSNVAMTFTKTANSSSANAPAGASGFISIRGVSSSITVSGTCKTYNKSTNCADGETVAINVNTIDAGTATTSGGTWSLSIPKPDSASNVSIYMSGVADGLEANAFAVYDGSGDLTSIPLIEETLTLFDGGSQINGTSLGSYDNSVTSNEDIFFDINGSGYLYVDNTSQSTQERLYIATAANFQLNGYIYALVNFENYGTFTLQTGNTMLVAGSFYNDSSATMTMQSGTTAYFTATSTGHTVTSGGDAFDSLTFNATNGEWTLQDNITVAGVLTAQDGILQAGATTITLSGTSGSPFVSYSNHFNAGTSTVVYTGNYASDDTTVNATTYYNLIVNNSSETYKINTTVNVNNDFTISAGVFNGGSDGLGVLKIGGNFTNNGTFTSSGASVVEFNDNTKTSTLTGSTSFRKFRVTTAGKDLLFTAGQTFTINDILTVTGSSGAGNEITFNSTTGSSAWTINMQGGGSPSYLKVTWSACDGASLTINTTNSIDGGNNGACWLGLTSSGITVSGTVYLADGSSPDPTVRSLKLSVAGGTAQTTSSTVTTGAFSFTTASTPADGDIITIWINGETPKGTLVIRYGSSCTGTPNCTGLSVQAGQVILNQKYSSGFTTTNLATCDSNAGTGCNTADIGYNADTGASTVTLGAGHGLTIISGTTFAPTGDTTIPDSLTNAGTYTLAGSTDLTLGANFSNTGTFTAGSGSTVEFNDSSQVTTISGSNSFSNFSVNTPGKRIKFTAGTTTVIGNNFVVQGANGSPVILESTSAGSSWTVNYAGVMDNFDYATIRWSACHGSSSNITLNETSNNGGNNGSCWLFPVKLIGGGGSSSDGGAGSGSSGGGGGSSGGTGDVQATATANTNSGVVISITINNGGSGYISVPLACVVGGGGSGAELLAVIGSGAVTAINVLTGGSGYVGGPTVSIGAPGTSGGTCGTGSGGGGSGGGGGGSP